MQPHAGALTRDTGPIQPALNNRWIAKVCPPESSCSKGIADRVHERIGEEGYHCANTTKKGVIPDQLLKVSRKVHPGLLTATSLRSFRFEKPDSLPSRIIAAAASSNVS